MDFAVDCCCCRLDVDNNLLIEAKFLCRLRAVAADVGVVVVVLDDAVGIVNPAVLFRFFLLLLGVLLLLKLLCSTVICFGESSRGVCWRWLGFDLGFHRRTELDVWQI